MTASMNPACWLQLSAVWAGSMLSAGPLAAAESDAVVDIRPSVAAETLSQADPALPDPTPDADTSNAGHKRIEVAVAPYPLSSPGLGTGIAVVALAAIRPTPDSTRPITVAAGGFATEPGSWGVGAGGRADVADDRIRIAVGLGKGHLVYDYYGVGVDSGENGTSVRLDQNVAMALGRIYFRIADSLYLGPEVAIRHLTVSPHDALPAGADVAVDSTGRSVGVGGEFDSRDSQFYPTAGWLITANLRQWRQEGTSHLELPMVGVLESTQTVRYPIVEAALNRFDALGASGVLALRLATRWAGADTPSYDLSQLGRGPDLRGYEAGRYRDHTLLATQAEYRHDLGFWRLGATAFGGLGWVAPAYADLFSSGVLPAAGLGLRWTAATENHINLRFDTAWSKTGSTWYLSVGEAF
jgi:hypothetical protein